MNETKHAEFMQVGDFVANFGGNQLPHTDDLAGLSLDIHFDDGRLVRYSFRAGQQLEWQLLDGAAQGVPDRALESYRATCLRDGYYLVDFIMASQPTRSVSLVIDLVGQIATLVSACMPSRQEAFKPLFQRVLDRELLTPVRAAIAHGAIDRPFTAETAQHEPTGELVGKRVHYRYGPSDAYEHIYLNRDFYTWNCVQGPEAGLSDTDYCCQYKLAEQLYLFVWLEKVIPTLGVILIDFRQAKTSGKIFGYRGADFGATCNTPVGAVLTLKNETSY